MFNQQRKKNPSAFLRNIFNILQNPQLNQVIEWAPTQNGFIIKNLNLFQANILPQYFKHKKYSSFVRQLNMYGFHKQRNSIFENCFLHDHFKRGQQLPCDIKRKPQKKKKINEKSSQNASRESLDWFSIGEQFKMHLPHVAQSILINPTKQIKKNIVLTQQRKLSIEQIKKEQKMIQQNSQQQQQEYVSKISLKGFLFQTEQNQEIQNLKIKQQDQREGSQINQQNHNFAQNQCFEVQKSQPIDNYSNSELSEQKSVSQQVQGQYQLSYQLSKQNSQTVKQNKLSIGFNANQNNFNSKQKSFNSIYKGSSFSSYTLNISENSFQSLKGLSQILIKQNQSLRKIHPLIREMVLKSQENKIKYLNQELKQEQEVKQIEVFKSYLNQILISQEEQLTKLANALQDELKDLAQFSTTCQDYNPNPMSTTSIRFRLDKNI